MNVGIGNNDDDPELEIIATYDNHHIQAFNHDGVAINASPWFRNRPSGCSGLPMTWGQFIRWPTLRWRRTTPICSRGSGRTRAGRNENASRF